MKIGIGVGISSPHGQAHIPAFDWNPAAVHASGLVSWVRADNASAYGPGLSLPDKSGSGNAFSTVGGIISSSVQNGKPGILFNGTTEYAQSPDWTGANKSDPNTIVMVFKDLAPDGSQFYFDNYPLGGTTPRHCFFAQSTSRAVMFDGTDTVANTATAFSNSSIIICRFNGASSKLRVNGVQTTGAMSGATALDGFTLMAHTSLSGGFVNGYLFEFVYWNDALTDGECASVESNINTFWALGL